MSHVVEVLIHLIEWVFYFKYDNKLINFILIFVDHSTISSSFQWAGVVTGKDNTDNVREEQDLIIEEVEDDNSVLIEVHSCIHDYMYRMYEIISI